MPYLATVLTLLLAASAAYPHGGGLSITPAAKAIETKLSDVDPLRNNI